MVLTLSAHKKILLMVSALMMSCAKLPTPGNTQRPLVLFSEASAPSSTLPAGWYRQSLRPGKKETQYEMVVDAVEQPDGTSRQQTVLRATAYSSASALMHRPLIDITQRPYLRWQWKINHLIASADTTSPYDDDSPVRIIVAFDGDKSKLSGRDRLFMEKAKLISGHELPFATLMYIWENKQPVGTVIRNSYTGRIRKIVVGSGAQGIGQWQSLERNLKEDYERAFGEPPGELYGIGVMTDTDNTQSSVKAFYGDISFHETPLRR